ncbi:unnamed protein product [Allacma fusca]|uniref:Uncharacterized protein n=1 Tax=Allacma fusca TaxID=39272 RepID=A0A8J2LNX1_9HEXA|nr:unnamed protein product [Allacma fusca]
MIGGISSGNQLISLLVYGSSHCNSFNAHCLMGMYNHQCLTTHILFSSERTDSVDIEVHQPSPLSFLGGS